MKRGDYIKSLKLVSSDNKEYSIEVEAALQSKAISIFLENNQHLEIYSSEKTIKLPISGKLLKRLIEFMEHKYNCANNGNKHLDFDIYDDEVKDLFDAATYLRI